MKRRNGFLFAAFVLATTRVLGADSSGVIVRFAKPTDVPKARSFLGSRLFGSPKPVIPEINLYEVKIRPDRGITMSEAVDALSRNSRILYVQPDHILRIREESKPVPNVGPETEKKGEEVQGPDQRVPDDSKFGEQWNFSNASEGVDIRAVRAWKYGVGGANLEGNQPVVAVVDGGLDLHHEDLEENLWTNPAEVPGNGIDDDQNGYVDDVYGWNAYDGNSEIGMDDHATHVAGIVGARGNNQKDVTGVNWNAKLLVVAASSGKTSIVAQGYGYVIAMKKLWLESGGKKGANIVVTNSSFGVDFGKCDSGEFPIWNDLYDQMGKLGILSAAATINDEIDVDEKGDVPTGCTSPYLVTVTNTDRSDLINYAGFGAKSIDLSAPGTSIVSTLPANQVGALSGTSMATPHVSGSIALMYSLASQDLLHLVGRVPGEGALALKSLLLSQVDPVESLQGKTVTGGRLNLYQAARAAMEYQAPGKPSMLPNLIFPPQN